MTLAAGTKLGPYEIQSPLGAGGMGEVYKARDTRLERTVAIKVLNSSLVASPEMRARFEREAKTISQFNHPNICTLYDVGHHDGTDFLVMEFIEGESLADRLKRGPLPLSELLRIGSAIADALDRAHRAGIIHRDLKPGNVILTKAGAKLLDFGLAKPQVMSAAAGEPKSASVFAAAMTQTSPASPLSTAGALVGTVQYMAPEQIGGQEADARSDIFAFGMLLYEMATGKRAFDGKTQASIVGAILAIDPPDITNLQPSLPRALARVVRISLTKDPDERYQSVHDLKLELEAIAEAGEAATPTAKATSRERMAWMAATLALVAVLALPGWMLLRHATPAPVIRAMLLPPKGVRVAPTQIALSPDGRRIAYVGGNGNGESLYIRALSSTESQPVGHTEGAAYPFWSPDGEWLGFFANGKLNKLDLATGGSVVLADAGAGRGGAWGPDNLIVFSPEAAGGLRMVSDSGGPVSPLTTSDPNDSHRWPQFLAGGRYLIYWTASNRNTGAVSADPSDSKTGEYLLDLKTKQSRLLLQSDSGAVYADGYLLYIWQNNLMAQKFDPATGKVSGTASLVTQKVAFDSDRWIGGFSATSHGLLALVTGDQLLPSQLAWVDRTGKEVARIGNLGIYFWPSLSPDDKRVAYSADESRQTSTWIFDLDRRSKTRFTFENEPTGYAVWSRDGKQIAYTTGPTNTVMAVKSSSGIGQPEKLVEVGNFIAPVSWTPDDRSILYVGALQANKDTLWLYSLADKKSTQLPVPPRVESARLSPNGKWLAYVSRENGNVEVFVAPFPDLNAKWQVSNSGGTSPSWSRNGKELFYVGGDGKLMAVAISTAGGFLAGIPKPLFALRAPAFPGYQYDVARDGRFLVNELMDQGSTEPITLVTNWTAELKKK